jgi:hypothetical protein
VEGRDQPPPDRPDEESPWATTAEEEDTEPDWAEQIRSSRKARGKELRKVYSTFADEPTPLEDEADPE